MKRATVTALHHDVVGIISIHALVKRATELYEVSTDWLFDFNPRPREEGDLSAVTP